MQLNFSAALVQALLAFPLLSNAATIPAEGDASVAQLEARADCTLYAHWLTNWNEYGLRRYRVKIGQDPGNSNEYTDQFHNIFMGYGWGEANNPQCFWNPPDNSRVCDVSFAEGIVGHNAYKTSFQEPLNLFRARTGCDVNSAL
ncbi:unnamed protein product [Periconia digitata]|uniref:Uncharacterized protein n=1 Tax=Periconia digitata TaxID=1303443 RepID=A0A9W4UP60_9PLEO|nr:unnamed protein product [Periconia digitata]